MRHAGAGAVREHVARDGLRGRGEQRRDRALFADVDRKEPFGHFSMVAAMGFTAADPDFESRVHASFARQGIMRLIGASITPADSGASSIYSV